MPNERLRFPVFLCRQEWSREILKEVIWWGHGESCFCPASPFTLLPESRVLTCLLDSAPTFDHTVTVEMEVMPSWW